MNESLLRNVEIEPKPLAESHSRSRMNWTEMDAGPRFRPSREGMDDRRLPFHLLTVGTRARLNARKSSHRLEIHAANNTIHVEANPLHNTSRNLPQHISEEGLSSVTTFIDPRFLIADGNSVNAVIASYRKGCPLPPSSSCNTAQIAASAPTRSWTRTRTQSSMLPSTSSMTSIANMFR